MYKVKLTTTFFILLISFSFSNSNELDKFKGFFDFSYDESKDKIFLEVDKLDYEFLYIGSLTSGVGSNDIGLDRGQLGLEKLVKFVKRGNKILLVEPNLYYRAQTENKSEKKSVEQAFAKSEIWRFTIKQVKGKSYIIDLNDFLLHDAHDVSDRLKNRKQGSYSCLLYTSPSPRDRTRSRMPSSA